MPNFAHWMKRHYEHMKAESLWQELVGGFSTLNVDPLAQTWIITESIELTVGSI